MVIKEIVQINVNRFLNWKMVVVFAIYSIFCFFSKGPALAIGLNYFEYVAEVLGEQHNIVYFMIPIYFFSIMSLLTDQNNFTIIRVRKYKNYFLSKCSIYFGFSLLFVFCALLTLSIMGLGLPLKNEYAATLNYPMYYIGPAYKEIFKTPLALILAQSIHLIFGFTFLSIILEACYIFFNNKNILLGILGTSYIFTVIGVSGKLRNGTSLFLISHYTVLMNTPYFLIKTIILEVIIILGIIFMVSRVWHKKAMPFETLKRLFRDNWLIKQLLSKRFILVVIPLLSIANITLYLNYDLTYFSDYIQLQLLGYGYGYFNIIAFSALLIVMCTPLFFQSYFLEESFKNHSCFVKVRYGSRAAYLKQTLGIYFIFVCIYIGLLFMTSLLESIVISPFGGLLLDSENAGFFNMAFSVGILKALLLKGLELYMILSISLIIVIYTRKSIFSFLLIMGGYLLNIFDLPLIKYNPFGISSIVRWGTEYEGHVSFSLAFIILCFANMILLAFLALEGKKRII